MNTTPDRHHRSSLRDDRVLRAIESQRHRGRLCVALAGQPGVGKSSVSARLSSALSLMNIPNVVLGMDGFHLDNILLKESGMLSRKGAPETFDVSSLSILAQRIAHQKKGDSPIYAPMFDRNADLSRAGALAINPTHQVILFEGNYLLLNEPPWQPLHQCWHLTVMLRCPTPIIRQRLMQRWLEMGVSQEEASNRVEGNDLVNAQRVRAHSVDADVILDTH